MIWFMGVMNKSHHRIEPPWGMGAGILSLHMHSSFSAVSPRVKPERGLFSGIGGWGGKRHGIPQRKEQLWVVCSQWCAGVSSHSLEVLTVGLASQLPIQWLHPSSLKLAMMGAFDHENQQKLQIRGFTPTENQSLNIYQHTPGQHSWQLKDGAQASEGDLGRAPMTSTV